MTTIEQFEMYLNGLIATMETLSHEAGVAAMTISYEAQKTRSPESSGVTITYRVTSGGFDVTFPDSPDTYLPESLRKTLTTAIDAYYKKKNKIIFRKFS